MAIKPHHRKPVRSLLLMLLMVVGLAATLGVGHVWGEGASWAPQSKAAPIVPKKGMDLEGGTEVILKPQTRPGEAVSEEQLARAIDVIRARVDGQGVAEANVSKLGENVQVSIPGALTPEQEDTLRRSSQMRFRPVIQLMEANPKTAQPNAPAQPPAGAPSAKPSASGSASPAGKPSASAPTSGAPSPSTSQRAVMQPGLMAPLPGQTTAPAPSGAPALPPPGAVPGLPGAPGAVPGAPAKPTPAPLPKEKALDPQAVADYALDQAWLTPEYQKKFAEYECTTMKNGVMVQQPYDPTQEKLEKPLIACQFDDQKMPDGSIHQVPTAKFLLGPAIFDGSGLATASAAAATNQQGMPTGGFEVRLSMKGEYAPVYAEVSRRMTQWQKEPRGRLATVLDNRVIASPYFASAIPNGEAKIDGFNEQTSLALANQLKFGALPVNFQMESRNSVSPTLGEDQMNKGLIAGFIGLFLVVVYSLFQYRLLGLVTVASLVIVAVLTWMFICFFGWTYNLRLTMAGITGAIVAIGTTADSFIIYFERVRDEVREGRQLRSAVEAGWSRATHTILISDAVNFLAALVLYILASHNVKGFAFMLMLTTVLDVIVVFWFTHPMLTLLASTKLFREGHPWSGLDPKSLRGDGPRYRGAGRVGSSPLSTKESHA